MSRLQELLAKTKNSELKLILPLIIDHTKEHPIPLREVSSALNQIQHKEVLHAEAFEYVLNGISRYGPSKGLE